LIKQDKLNQHLSQQTIHLTFPTPHIQIPSKHPLTPTLQHIQHFFLPLRYQIVHPYQLQQHYYNFQPLNLPKSHPPRHIQDTFYITEE
ncbi:tRNA ligase subunit PheS family protein, partial [Staphylococcus epidermidis]